MLCAPSEPFITPLRSMMSDIGLVGAIVLPDGVAIRGRALHQPLPPGPVPTYGLYLEHPLSPWLRRLVAPLRPTWRPDWPSEWISWPDFGTPQDDDQAAKLIRNAIELARQGERVEVACHGGTGRTGTVIACMAVVGGLSPSEAISWTRSHYRRPAVETEGQRLWVAWFGSQLTTGTSKEP